MSETTGKNWDKAIVIVAIIVSGTLMILSVFFPSKSIALQAFAGTLLTIFTTIEVYFNHIQKLRKDNAELDILKSREAGAQLTKIIDKGISKLDLSKKTKIENKLDSVPSEDQPIIILEQDLEDCDNCTESTIVDEKIKSIFEKED